MDWTGCDVVESSPLRMHGKPIVKGTRMDADGLLENYEYGMSLDELHYQFGVDRDKIKAALEYAALKQQSIAS